MIVASAAESTSLHPEATSSVQWVPNASCIVCKIIFSRFCKEKYASLVESEIFHSNWLYENEVITSIDAEVWKLIRIWLTLKENRVNENIEEVFCRSSFLLSLLTLWLSNKESFSNLRYC